MSPNIGDPTHGSGGEHYFTAKEDFAIVIYNLDLVDLAAYGFEPSLDDIVNYDDVRRVMDNDELRVHGVHEEEYQFDDGLRNYVELLTRIREGDHDQDDLMMVHAMTTQDLTISDSDRAHLPPFVVEELGLPPIFFLPLDLTIKEGDLVQIVFKENELSDKEKKVLNRKKAVVIDIGPDGKWNVELQSGQQYSLPEQNLQVQPSYKFKPEDTGTFSYQCFEGGKARQRGEIIVSESRYQHVQVIILNPSLFLYPRLSLHDARNQTHTLQNWSPNDIKKYRENSDHVPSRIKIPPNTQRLEGDSYPSRSQIARESEQRSLSSYKIYSWNPEAWIYFSVLEFIRSFDIIPCQVAYPFQSDLSADKLPDDPDHESIVGTNYSIYTCKNRLVVVNTSALCAQNLVEWGRTLKRICKYCSRGFTLDMAKITVDLGSLTKVQNAWDNSNFVDRSCVTLDPCFTDGMVQSILIGKALVTSLVMLAIKLRMYEAQEHSTEIRKEKDKMETNIQEATKFIESCIDCPIAVKQFTREEISRVENELLFMGQG